MVIELKRFYCVSFDVFVCVCADERKGKENEGNDGEHPFCFLPGREEERERETGREEKRSGEKEKMFDANLNVVFIGT